MRATLALVLAAVLASVGSITAARPTASRCDVVASPSGSDVASGTAAAPFRTPRRLLRSLRAGRTGCLRAGSYREDLTVRRSGRPGAPLTLRSYPGERAVLRGRLWIAGSWVTVSGLSLDGRNATHLPSPTITGDDDTFLANNVTNHHTSICFDLGFPGYGRADDALIMGNRIHDCGRLPATNEDHGIYVALATGTRIVANVIYDNSDRGVQLYPDAQRTTITGNVIDGNGEGVIFSGGPRRASSGNVVRANVIANSRVRRNVESFYNPGEPAGRNNLVEGNCLWGGRLERGNGSIQTPTRGFVARDNTVANPRYVNRSAGDFRVRDARCARLVGVAFSAP